MRPRSRSSPLPRTSTTSPRHSPWSMESRPSRAARAGPTTDPMPCSATRATTPTRTGTRYASDGSCLSSHARAARTSQTWASSATSSSRPSRSSTTSSALAIRGNAAPNSTTPSSPRRFAPVQVRSALRISTSPIPIPCIELMSQLSSPRLMPMSMQQNYEPSPAPLRHKIVSRVPWRPRSSTSVRFQVDDLKLRCFESGTLQVAFAVASDTPRWHHRVGAPGTIP